MLQVGRRESLSGMLARTVAERIGSGQYGVGERLPSEQEMVGEFGVSRTVVREAIANLRANGLVVTAQGRGAFVVRQERPEAFQIDAPNLSLVQEIISILELRIALESEAAVLAAQRCTDVHLSAMKAALSDVADAISADEDAAHADMRFHRCIAEAAGNRHFLNLFDYLGVSIIPRTRLPSYRAAGDKRRDYLESVQREHEQICYAIERRDPEAARAAMRLHLTGSRDRLLSRMDRVAGPATG